MGTSKNIKKKFFFNFLNYNPWGHKELDMTERQST